MVVTRQQSLTGGSLVDVKQAFARMTINDPELGAQIHQAVVAKDVKRIRNLTYPVFKEVDRQIDDPKSGSRSLVAKSAPAKPFGEVTRLLTDAKAPGVTLGDYKQAALAVRRRGTRDPNEVDLEVVPMTDGAHSDVKALATLADAMAEQLREQVGEMLQGAGRDKSITLKIRIPEPDQLAQPELSQAMRRLLRTTHGFMDRDAHSGKTEGMQVLERTFQAD